LNLKELAKELAPLVVSAMRAEDVEMGGENAFRPPRTKSHNDKAERGGEPNDERLAFLVSTNCLKRCHMTNIPLLVLDSRILQISSEHRRGHGLRFSRAANG
jgi:hypothetical protein